MINQAAGRAPAVAATRSRTGPSRRDQLAAAVLDGLVSAPVGRSPLIEAAYAWKRLRVGIVADFCSRSASPTKRPLRVPIAFTDWEQLAVRLVRLLSTLDWANVRPVDQSDVDRSPQLFYVDVPAGAASGFTGHCLLPGAMRIACRIDRRSQSCRPCRTPLDA